MRIVIENGRAIDPDPGGKNLRQNRKIARNLIEIVILLKQWGKFGPAPWFFTFEQLFLSFSTPQGNFYTLFKPDPDQL